MKVGDLVKFSEEHYPEYKGLFGLLTEDRADRTAWTQDRGPMWQVMVNGRIHPFYIASADITVVGFDHNKMIGGRL